MSQQQQSFPVRFTEAQRKVIAELLPELADRLKLEEPNVRTISFTPAELEMIRQKAEAARLNAANGMKRNSLRHIVETAAQTIDDSRGITAIPASQRIYQFQIKLLGSEPPIWRRIQIRDGTLDRLHEHIQTAMGWTNSHLHDFEIDGQRYGDPELIDDGYDEFHCIDSRRTKISQIVPRDGNRYRFRYAYDFGDYWEHEVLFEGCLWAEPDNRYPLCLEGERACPPEDVGGIGGYEEFLTALADPTHAEHQEYLEWIGSFDSEEFDAEKATKRMRRGLPNWRNPSADRGPQSEASHEDLWEMALAMQEEIVWTYKQHQQQRPVVLFHLQEQRIYVYPYEAFKNALNARSQTIFEAQYREAQQNEQIVVFVKDTEGGRFVSFSLDIT